MTDLPQTGRCRCGATEITVTAAPIMTAACHCTGCQRMSASAFSLTAMFPAAAIAVTKGQTVIGGAGSDLLAHHCCPACMTWMFTRITGMDFVNVRPTMFDVPDWATPFIETMTDESLPWARTPARHRFAGFPPQAEFMGLMEAYATRAGGAG